MNLKVTIIFILLNIISPSNDLFANSYKVLRSIRPNAETTPTHSKGDAADDPAIWVHPSNPLLSKILGTNKKSGLQIFDLKGREVFKWNKYPLNNIDIRYGIKVGDKKIDVVIGSSKQINGFVVLGIDREKDGSSVYLLGGPFKTGPLAYGICLYQEVSTISNKDNLLFAFVTHKTGAIEQWQINSDNTGSIISKKLRTLQVSSQVEGCVVDDKTGTLYVSEEDVGLWKFSADRERGDKGKLIASITNNIHLKADLEGVTLYKGERGMGYILLSVQGKSEVAVFDLNGENDYLFSFSIAENRSLSKKIDKVSYTDGIDVISTYLGPDYPQGLLVIQDDENTLGIDGEKKKVLNQNFKIVPWHEISNSVEPPLVIP